MHTQWQDNHSTAFNPDIAHYSFIKPSYVNHKKVKMGVE